MPSLLPANQLRLRFARALSRMYQQEVPQYLVLQKLVDRINAENHARLQLIDLPRHGAVRLASLEELRMAARFFNVMGMKSVSHYDLSSAGLPVHATAFRPVTPEELSVAPFRLFVSVLRPELLTRALQPLAKSLLSQRSPVFSQKTMTLVERAEAKGGLTAPEADDLIRGGCETLAWRNQVSLTKNEYDTLKSDRNGDLLIDIMAFRNPHLNHLTPATVNINAVQRDMPSAGLAPKDRVEGPPERKCNVLLRQTSFLAVDEGIVFDGPEGKGEKGSHCARFGEIEQRGAALTPKGRRKYDEVVFAANHRDLLKKGKEAEYKLLFDSAFPDDWESLRAEGLIWVEYSLTQKGSEISKTLGSGEGAAKTLQKAIEEGLVTWRPILYEDFLPLSAAGIFQSNLRHDSTVRVTDKAAGGSDKSKQQLRHVLGEDAMLDEMKLYEAQQEGSIAEVGRHLGISP